MNTVALGERGPTVSTLGLGTSALGGVFGDVSERSATETVEAALDVGITLFDTAPAYGSTVAERRLGAALEGVPRHAYVLSTKAGKHTDSEGTDRFDFSATGIRRSVEASLERLRVDRIDIVHLHDFEYADGRHVEQAMHEGFDALVDLKGQGLVGAIGAGIYPIDIWKRVLIETDLDVALVHNHHTLSDLRAFELLPLARARGVGVLNAAPLASGLLTDDGPPPWHPASPRDRSVFARAAARARELSVPIAEVALAFSAQEPQLPVTIFSCADPETLRRNVTCALEPVDRQIVAEVQRALEPVMYRQWSYSGGSRPSSASAERGTRNHA